ncbi:MAG TPA: outer membrane protein assembly factor BamE [Steroidobacteraceae bacterium]|jgi:outer membrane protein assembly factor BamE
MTTAIQFRMFRNALLCVVVALTALTGCVYRIDIQQGNFLDTKDIDRVTVGMTRLQVKSLLGTPMVADPFEGWRWDYIYYFKRGRWTKAEQTHFTVYFEEDKVTRIDRSGKPAETKPDTVAS